MSVQITVVEPSASTAGSCVVRAWCAAMRRTPTARDTDRVAGILSGTSATIAARAKTKESTEALPVWMRNALSSAPAAMAIAATRRAMSATWRWSGLGSGGCSAVSR